MAKNQELTNRYLLAVQNLGKYKYILDRAELGDAKELAKTMKEHFKFDVKKLDRFPLQQEMLLVALEQIDFKKAAEALTGKGKKAMKQELLKEAKALFDAGHKVAAKALWEAVKTAGNDWEKFSDSVASEVAKGLKTKAKRKRSKPDTLPKVKGWGKLTEQYQLVYVLPYREETLELIVQWAPEANVWWISAGLRVANDLSRSVAGDIKNPKNTAKQVAKNIEKNWDSASKQYK